MKFLLSIAVMATLTSNVYGHGFMDQPMARNVYAHREGRSGNPSEIAAIPLYQTTPQGLNRNNNLCGMDQGYPDNDYDLWLDTQGNPMPWISQAFYNPGETIQVDTYLTAHHKGYLEVKACPLGRQSSQDCFDSYPLEFVKDLLYDMPKDDSYPGRGYLHGTEARLSMQFKLPQGLAGEQVLLQWVYWTANSCNPIGLAEYYSTPKPIGSTGPNWAPALSTCPPESETPLAPLPNPDSTVMAPERFINCAEVTISGDQTPTPPFPSPTKSPTPPSVENPISLPVEIPPTDPNVAGTCGGGNTGNGVCPDQSMCCSKWGHCGYESTGHCDEVAPIVNTPTSLPVSSPTSPVESPPTDPNMSGTCGGGNTGNGICPDRSMCCSKWGHCGFESTGHCDKVAPLVITPSTPTSSPVITPTFPPVNPPTFAPVNPPTSTPIITPPSLPVESPPSDPNAVGSCGGGNTGNGICADPSMCCSKWGYCGFKTTGHCDEVAPINKPVASPPVSVPPSDRSGDSRMIAYVGNWQACPTDAQISQYTHIVIAFAVSYTWSPGKNICSSTCEIAEPPVCENAARPELIQKWKGMGKKVILSYGGAGMGGSWAGDSNDCWDYCFGRETQVVNRLTQIVNEMDLDGVDIDYEYFYEDNQNGSGFTKGSEAQKFLKDVTLGLRSSMPTGAELTHAPMEPDMVPGKAYFNMMKEVASSLDFLMPQYYNGFVRSYNDFSGALSHYRTLTDELFGGDASKVVYGFCIGDCGSFNLDGYQSAEVMEKLAVEYPCNGGAFFWVANHDSNGSWSGVVNDQLDFDANKCAFPSSAPSLLRNNLSTPTLQPSCAKDSKEVDFQKNPDKNPKPCKKFAGKGKLKKRRKKCNKRFKFNGQAKKVWEWCPTTCGKAGVGTCSYLHI